MCLEKHIISDGENLNGAHGSLVNVNAQTDVYLYLHPFFIPYIDRKASIPPTDLIFMATQHNAWKKTMEPNEAHPCSMD